MTFMSIMLSYMYIASSNYIFAYDNLCKYVFKTSIACLSIILCCGNNYLIAHSSNKYSDIALMYEFA